MDPKKPAELTDEELIREAKKIKNSKRNDAVIIGVLIGIALYSSVVNGFGFLTFLPLLYLPIAARNTTRNKALENRFKEKNLT